MAHSHADNLLADALHSLELQKQAYCAYLDTAAQLLRDAVLEHEDGHHGSAHRLALAASTCEEQATGDGAACQPLVDWLGSGDEHPLTTPCPPPPPEPCGCEETEELRKLVKEVIAERDTARNKYEGLLLALTDAVGSTGCGAGNETGPELVEFLVRARDEARAALEQLPLDLARTNGDLESARTEIRILQNRLSEHDSHLESIRIALGHAGVSSVNGILVAVSELEKSRDTARAEVERLKRELATARDRLPEWARPAMREIIYRDGGCGRCDCHGCRCLRIGEIAEGLTPDQRRQCEETEP